MKKCLFILLLFLTACQNSESTLMEANEELPFHVLKPVELSEEWKIQNIIYEDDMVITIYENEENGVIEFIQDQNIQGLDHLQLKDFMKDGERVGDQLTETPPQPMMIDDYIGEWAVLNDHQWDMQYTFLRQFDLFQEPVQGVSYYQVIGRDVPAEKIIEFVETLNIIHS